MRISVIIPVYNVGELLRKSVGSVMDQIGENAEIIIVDDGSTDDSGRICDEYLNIPNVSVIHKTNGGLSSARNAGIDHAHGDYLLFLDSDDYLLPGSIDLLSTLLKQTGKCDFIQFRYEEVSDYSNKSTAGTVSDFVEIRDRCQMFERKYALGGIGASACTKLISRDVFRSLRFKEGIIHEDEQFTIHLIDRAQRALYISNALYMYVQRPGSIITSGFSQKRLDIIAVLEEQMAVLSSYGYDHLVALVRNNLFTALCIMYVQARRADMSESVKTIRDHAKSIVGDVTLNKGTIGLIAKGMKLGFPMLQLYYMSKLLRHGKN